jgi:AcrR family transcriptional regulator
VRGTNGEATSTKNEANAARTSEQTQAAILSASIRLLGERGYAVFSASRVAAAAGVSRGAQEHYFPTKHDLIVASTRYAMREAVDHARSLARSATRSKDPLDGDAAAFSARLKADLKNWAEYVKPAKIQPQ